jgi:hypothetical protein
MLRESEGRDALEVLDELLAEKDLFRLVIRGFALISDELDEAIENAFGGPIPSELSRLRLPARLALAEALSAVTPEISLAIQRLGKIRHRLAHSVAGEASDNEIRGVWEATVAAGELDDQDPEEYSPGDELRLAISALWTAVDDAGAEAYVMRAEAQKALTAYRQGRAARSQEIFRAWQETREAARRAKAGQGGAAALHDGDT